jgi:hypothetical protein
MRIGSHMRDVVPIETMSTLINFTSDEMAIEARPEVGVNLCLFCTYDELRASMNGDIF